MQEAGATGAAIQPGLWHRAESPATVNSTQNHYLLPVPLAPGVGVGDVGDMVEPDELDEPAEPLESLEPVDPVDPVEPDVPLEPVEPEEPVEPVDPLEPVEPIEPDEPLEPADPAEPLEPVDPEEPLEPVEPEELPGVAVGDGTPVVSSVFLLHAPSASTAAKATDETAKVLNFDVIIKFPFTKMSKQKLAIKGNQQAINRQRQSCEANANQPAFNLHLPAAHMMRRYRSPL
jgi:hypothetical protein